MRTRAALFFTVLLMSGTPQFGQAQKLPKPEKTETHHYERTASGLTHTYTTPDGSKWVTHSTIGGRYHGSSTTTGYDRNGNVIQRKVVEEQRNANGTLGRTIEVEQDRRGRITTHDTQRGLSDRRPGHYRTEVNVYKGDVFKRLPPATPAPRTAPRRRR